MTIGVADCDSHIAFHPSRGNICLQLGGHCSPKSKLRRGQEKRHEDLPAAGRVAFVVCPAMLAPPAIGANRFLTCSSNDGRYRYCRADTQNNVRLVRQLSKLTYPAAFAVRRGNLEFVNFLNSWIEARTANKWLDQRRTYWFKTTEWAKDL